MCTILLNKNGSFYEMPLNNYANLGAKIREYGLKKIDERFITPFVQLGNFVDIEKLLNYNYNTNSYMVKPTYVSKQKRK